MTLDLWSEIMMPMRGWADGQVIDNRRPKHKVRIEYLVNIVYEHYDLFGDRFNRVSFVLTHLFLWGFFLNWPLGVITDWPKGREGYLAPCNVCSETVLDSDKHYSFNYLTDKRSRTSTTCPRLHPRSLNEECIIIVCIKLLLNSLWRVWSALSSACDAN